MLTPNLTSPLEALHKLERESHRAFHHKNYTHKSDHFYNFCITALSIKDYVFSHLGIEKAEDKQPYYDEWASINCLRAATEIANSSKHSILNNTPKTKGVEQTTSTVINVYINDAGDIKEVPEEAPDYVITLPDKKTILLFEFGREVIEYWKVYLESIGIEYVAQQEHSYFGDEET